MNSIVIYATHQGNTRAIGDAIAGALGARGVARLLPAAQAPPTIPAGTDLLIVGSPTEGHRMLPALADYLAALKPGALDGVAAAAFDTRLRGPLWLWGAAGVGIARELRRAGARVIAPAESFFVDMTPHLLPGEVEHAAAWARSLADRVAGGTTAPPARAA